uniref:Uncharacterized protein n=1 Tax=Daphnia galeata TaxID=27404 RepID=A0A8J2RDF9_9CRUS|nr:unnamed protein product [Daphnia galeata]
MASSITVENQGKCSQKSQIPRALSLIKRGMAFMKRNSPIRSNLLKRANSDAGTSVRPKKLTENLDCQQQPSEEISSVQESNKSSSKTTKTPNKLVKSVSSSKKPLYTRPSPYSYSTKKPQPSRIPVRRCISVTPIGERIANLESQENDLVENLKAVREKLEHLKELRYNNLFFNRLNRQSSNFMPKIEESDMESIGSSPSVAYIRPIKPRRLSIKVDQ